MGRSIYQNWSVIVLTVLFCLSGFASAHASVSDTPRFRIDGFVIVWGANDGASATAKIGSSIRVTPNVARSALPTATPIAVTGTLLPIPDRELVALADTQMNFHVASNTAFSIDAQVLSPIGQSFEDLAATSFDLTASLGDGGQFGTKARFPHTGGPDGGMAADIRSLADLVQRQRVFTGNQSTAARPGSIMDQSVRFNIRLGTGARADKTPAPEIVFTVFVP